MPHPQFPRSAACGGHHRTEGPSSGQRPGRAAGSGEELVLWPRPARPHTALCHTAQICLNGCCFLCLQRGILPAISVTTPGGYTPIRGRHGHQYGPPPGRVWARPGLLTVVTQNCGLPAVKIFALRGGCRWRGAAGRAAAASTSPLSTLRAKMEQLQLRGPAQLRLTRGSWQLVLPLHDPAPDTGHNFLICV